MQSLLVSKAFTIAKFTVDCM